MKMYIQGAAVLFVGSILVANIIGWCLFMSQQGTYAMMTDPNVHVMPSMPGCPFAAGSFCLKTLIEESLSYDAALPKNSAGAMILFVALFLFGTFRFNSSPPMHVLRSYHYFNERWRISKIFCYLMRIFSRGILHTKRFAY